MNKCIICGKVCEPDGFGAGYAIDKNKNKICYHCCGELDKDHLMLLKKKERMFLYLTDRGIENWPGTLLIKPTKRKIGKHNIAGIREDVWFELNGKHFHGVKYGEFGQICHINVTR